MKPLTDKQKKIAWIIAAVLVVLHFAPAMFHAALVKIAMHAQPKPPARPAPLPVLASSPAPRPAGFSPQQQAALLGVFEGSQINADNDECKVRLELRLLPDQPDRVSGYEARSCFNINNYTMQPTVNGGLAQAMRDYTPVATVMSGSYAGGAITFQVDKTVGSSPFVCPLASYAVTPFGQKAIVAQWRAEKLPRRTNCPLADGGIIVPPTFYVPVSEPFVSAEEAARFLSIKRRMLLSLARRGIAGAYALGTGESRKTWIFKLSELAAAIDPKQYDPLQGSPR